MLSNRSTNRQEYPHSLSYQARTLTSLSAMTFVDSESNIAECGFPITSTETNGSSVYCKIPFNSDISKNSEYSPTGIIAVSKAVEVYVKNNWNRECKRMFPAIEFNGVIVPEENKNEKEYIDMFNPLTRKGGEIF